MSRACVESAIHPHPPLPPPPHAHYHSDPNRGQLLISRTKNGIVRFRSRIVSKLLSNSSRKFDSNFPSSASLSVNYRDIFLFFFFFFFFSFLLSNERTGVGIVTPPNRRCSEEKQRKTMENGQTKGFLKTNGSKERRGERTGIEYHYYGTCIIGLHTRCSDPDDVLRSVDCPRAVRSTRSLVHVSIFADLRMNSNTYKYTGILLINLIVKILRFA